MKQSTISPQIDSKVFSCCYFLHIRTGTLLYGIFTVLLHLLILGLLILAAIHPDVLMKAKNKQPYDGIVVVQTETGDFFEKVGHPSAQQERITKDNLCVAFAMTLAWIMSVITLIYGVAKNQASYLMPCFCMQVFDFCLTCLTVVGCFSYAPNYQQWIKESGMDDLPVFRQLMKMDPQYLMVLVVTCVISVLWIKSFLMSMVWRCYKYIQLRVASRSVVREYTVDPDTEILLPPRYEDAIKMPAQIQMPGQGQPPAYTTSG